MMSVPFPDLENDWLTIVFFFLVLLLPYLVGEKAAKIPVIGYFARKIQEGQKRKKRAKVVTEAHLSEIVDEKVNEKLGLLQDEVELLADYLAYDASWHRRHDIHAGEQGWELPPPPHLNLREWMRTVGASWPESRVTRSKEKLEDQEE